MRGCIRVWVRCHAETLSRESVGITELVSEEFSVGVLAAGRGIHWSLLTVVVLFSNFFSGRVNYRERLRRGCRRPLNGVRHAETVAWQLHVVIVLDRFGGFWRWMTLNRSLPLWTAAVRKRFEFLFALVCENRKIAS